MTEDAGQRTGDRGRAKSLSFRHIASVVCLLSSGLCHPALAVQPDEVLKDPALEVRARALSRELRCLVRERLTAGDSDPQVVDFLVARYGEFVLLKPRFEWQTAVLWFTPAAALLAGAIAIVAAIRRRRGGPQAVAPLSPDEEQALAKMIEPK